MASITLYAELLVNIRQVTVLAILPSLSSEGTHVNLCEDQKTLTVYHDGNEESIELPFQVASDQDLKVPSIPSHELSFRLSISSEAWLARHASSDYSTEVPWPASKLGPETQLLCQSCGAFLVTNVTVWKDLPSGGWADMMDFWHCHKPTNEHDTNHSAGDSKGYAASNELGPTPGIGLVDTSSFWLVASDCTGIQVCCHFHGSFSL